MKGNRRVRALGAVLVVLLVATLWAAPVSAQEPPDLVPTQIITTTMYSGVANPIKAVVANNGTGDAEAFSVKLEVDGETFTQSVAGIAAGGWPSYVNFSWTPAAAGSYTLKVIVDPDNEVIESDETNNETTTSVDVIELAPVTVDVRVEGQTSTIWSGQVTFVDSTIVDSEGNSHSLDRPTALGALDAAASDGGFSYVAIPDYGPLYITEVAGEARAGGDGWSYRVDWISPDVGAGDYVLGPSQSVLWYYGVWGAKPMRLTVDSDVLEQGQTFTATVDAYDDMTSAWGPVEGATLYVDSLNYTTDASGQAIVSLSAGYYTLYAGKETYATYTRSNRVNVNVYMPFTLYTGWNFVSVPKKLAPGFDTAEQFFGEVDTAGHSIFQYSPASDWTAMSASDVVSPLDGIWVFSTSQQTLQPHFDTMPRRVPPTKQLGAGWNAIGFANLSPMAANSALTSVESKWSTLIGFDAQTQSYEPSVINNDHGGGDHDESTAMDIWKGYWLYMNSGGELAALSP